MKKKKTVIYKVFLERKNMMKGWDGKRQMSKMKKRRLWWREGEWGVTVLRIKLDFGFATLRRQMYAKVHARPKKRVYKWGRERESAGKRETNKRNIYNLHNLAKVDSISEFFCCCLLVDSLHITGRIFSVWFSYFHFILLLLRDCWCSLGFDRGKVGKWSKFCRKNQRRRIQN